MVLQTSKRQRRDEVLRYYKRPMSTTEVVVSLMAGDNKGIEETTHRARQIQGVIPYRNWKAMTTDIRSPPTTMLVEGTKLLTIRRRPPR